MSNQAFSLSAPSLDESAPYSLVGKAFAKPGKAEELEEILLSLVEPTRREEGALQYHVHRDRTNPDLFVFYEVWQSIDHLKAHLEQPYIINLLSQRMAFLARDMEVSWLNMVSPYPKAP